MPLLSDHNKLKFLLVLGCTLGALGGAFTAVGIPEPPPVAAPLEEAGSALSSGPVDAPVETLAMETFEPARRRPTLVPTTRRLTGCLCGPAGRLANTAVEMVRLPELGQPDRATHKVLTDAEGAFSLANPPLRGGTWALRVRAPGYGCLVRPVAGTTSPWPGTLNLTYSRWLAGRVVDEAGRPVAGARVLVGLSLGGSRCLYAQVGTTGRDGAFTARDLPVQETLRLLVDHPGFAPVAPQLLTLAAAGDLPPVTFHLARGACRRGRLERRGGGPAGGVQVVWELLHAGGARLVRKGMSDPQGVFELAGLPYGKGQQALWATSPRGRRHRLSAHRRGRTLVCRLPW